MDSTINQLFDAIVRNAEKCINAQGCSKIGAHQEPRRNHTREPEKLDINTDREMENMFEKIFQNAQRVAEKAYRHNRRLPAELLESELGSADALERIGRDGRRGIELYEKTKNYGPLKRFTHEFQHHGPVRERSEGKRSKRGGRRNKLKREVRGLKTLVQAPALTGDPYGRQVLQKKQLELREYRRQRRSEAGKPAKELRRPT